MHTWGDKWFEQYGDDLYEAECFIEDFTYRWSRCSLMSKEKYGTIRYEAIFAPYGGYFYRNRLHAYWIESKLCYWWARFGAWVCSKGVKKAVKKWPHLEEELCTFFDFDVQFGKQCQARYWK